MISDGNSLPLAIYADFVMNQVSINTHPLSNGPSAEPSKGGHPPVMVTKLPPGTKSDLKKGGQLDDWLSIAVDSRRSFSCYE
jgi:hypothetical protein